MMIQTILMETERQTNLIKIHEDLKKRKAKKIDDKEVQEITNLLKNTSCKFVKSAIDSGAKAFAVNLPKFDKLLGIQLNEKKRFVI